MLTLFTNKDDFVVNIPVDVNTEIGVYICRWFIGPGYDTQISTCTE